MQLIQEQKRVKANRHLGVSRISVGDLVLVNVRHAQRARLQLPQKVAPPFVGLYKVIAKVAENVYRLELPPQASRTHDVFNVSQLKKYQSNEPELNLLNCGCCRG